MRNHDGKRPDWWSNPNSFASQAYSISFSALVVGLVCMLCVAKNLSSSYTIAYMAGTAAAVRVLWVIVPGLMSKLERDPTVHARAGGVVDVIEARQAIIDAIDRMNIPEREKEALKKRALEDFDRRMRSGM